MFIGQMVKQTYVHNFLLGFSTYNGEVTAVDQNKEGVHEYHLIGMSSDLFPFYVD
jgi:hypothetical protein